MVKTMDYKWCKWIIMLYKLSPSLDLNNRLQYLNTTILSRFDKKKTFEVFKPTLYWLILRVNMLLYFRMVQHQPDLDIASTVHPLTLKRKNNLHLQSNFEYKMLEEFSCSQNSEDFSGYSHNNFTFINYPVWEK